MNWPSKFATLLAQLKLTPPPAPPLEFEKFEPQGMRTAWAVMHEPAGQIELGDAWVQLCARCGKIISSASLEPFPFPETAVVYITCEEESTCIKPITTWIIQCQFCPGN